MIKVKTAYGETILKPTIFPDGTSQIWKIEPREILYCRDIHITWNFESEREIIDLYSFSALLAQPTALRHVVLHIPYLPYGRQDKNISNDLTFNLEVFATLINNLHFNEVSSVDVHNPEKTTKLIHHFRNIDVHNIHEKVVMEFCPTFIVFPDKGAMMRYGSHLSHINTIFCDKVRDQYTGKITKLTLNYGQGYSLEPEYNSSCLIIDDICDGGATFIKVAEALKKECPNVQIGLFVSHGIFSKGLSDLIDSGISYFRTTDSLPKNFGLGYEV